MKKMNAMVLMCAVVLGGGVARGDVIEDVLGQVAGRVDVARGVTVEWVLQSVQGMEEAHARLDARVEPGWLLGLVDRDERAEVIEESQRVLDKAAEVAVLTEAALGDAPEDAAQADLDRLVQARVSLVGLRSARACLAMGVLTEDEAEKREWFARAVTLADASEGVSAWTRAERAVLLAQGRVLLGDGRGALQAIAVAQEDLRDATRAQRIEGLMALVAATAEAQGMEAAEGAWLRIVDRTPFVVEGEVDVSARATAIGVLTRLRLDASAGAEERRRVRREASDMLARLLGETDTESGAIFHELGRLRDPGIAIEDEPLPVVVGSLFGDFSNREILEAICRADVRSVPAGEARKEVLLAAVTFLYGSWNEALHACVADFALLLLEEHAEDARVLRLPGLLMPLADHLATEERLARARSIEAKLPDGEAKGRMRLAIAYAMAEMWDGTGDPPDVDAVLDELYTDELREKGVEFRRAFWKRVLVREEDRVAAGGEVWGRDRSLEVPARLIRVASSDDGALLDLVHAWHNTIVMMAYTPVQLTIGEDESVLVSEPDFEAIAALNSVDSYALRARMALYLDSHVVEALEHLAQQDEEITERTWRVMLLYDTALVRKGALAHVVALDREPIKFPVALDVLRAARWGVEEQGYELTAGMRRVLLRCSASARDAVLARWLAETIAEDVRGMEERLLLGEAWLAAGEDEKAFAVYRELGLDLEGDDPREYAYWAAYARMLEILQRRNGMGERSDEIVREVNRLRTLPGYDIHEDARWAIDQVAQSVGR